MTTDTQKHQRELTGPGSIRQLATLLSFFQYKSVFLVTGEHSFKQPALQSALAPIFEKTPHVRFSDFEKNPQLADIKRGIELFKSCDTPLVLAIGGGSVLDMAKLIRFFGSTEVSMEDYFLNQKPAVPTAVPLVAVPTTSGTGSEATTFATLYINRVKHSLDDTAILPDAVILDPQLTLSLPASVTMESGLDALTQAIESYWSIHSTPASKALALEAMNTLHANLETAVLKPDEKSREAMQHGANLAGKAICITRTTAAHAISYPMTSHFNVPHGQAVSISMPWFLEYNAQVTKADLLDARGVDYVRKTLSEICEALGYKNIADAKNGLIDLMKRIGAKTTLHELGIESKDHDLLVKNGFNPGRVKNNPRLLTEENLRCMLAAFGG